MKEGKDRERVLFCRLLTFGFIRVAVRLGDEVETNAKPRGLAKYLDARDGLL